MPKAYKRAVVWPGENSTGVPADCVQVMRHYNWQKAFIITTTDQTWVVNGLEITQKLQAAGITVLKEDNVEPSTIRYVKSSGIRVMLVLAYNEFTKTVALRALMEGMSSGWVWITVRHIMQPRFQGWLYIRPLLPSEGMQAFAEQVSDYTKSSFNISLSADSVDLTYSVALHDAIMLYAHAATKVLSEEGNLHDGKAVANAIRSTTFEGVGGRVALNQHGDRIESYEVMNYILGVSSKINLVPVGVYAKQQYTSQEEVGVLPPESTTQVRPLVPQLCCSAMLLYEGACRGRMLNWRTCLLVRQAM